MSDPPAFDWAGAAGQAWLAAADRLEVQLAPVSDLLFARAALTAGTTVLDVGCGRGATTRHAASLVAPGRVIGLDIGADLLAAAAALDEEHRCEWVQADAQTAELSDIAADVVISRFGVMFFADPLHAFANLLDATRPGGRLCAAIWQTRDRSPSQDVPMQAAIRVAGEFGLAPPDAPADGGPFSLGIEERTRDLLTRAGWTDIGYERISVPLFAGGPGSTPAQAVAVMASIGPFGEWARPLDPAIHEQVLSRVAEALAPYETPDGVLLDGGVAFLTATRR